MTLDRHMSARRTKGYDAHVSHSIEASYPQKILLCCLIHWQQPAPERPRQALRFGLQSLREPAQDQQDMVSAIDPATSQMSGCRHKVQNSQQLSNQYEQLIQQEEVRIVSMLTSNRCNYLFGA